LKLLKDSQGSDFWILELALYVCMVGGVRRSSTEFDGSQWVTSLAIPISTWSPRELWPGSCIAFEWLLLQNVAYSDPDIY
jgi:hypothetical protein